MTKREAELKSSLTAHMLRQRPRLYVLQYATAGAPDRSYVGNGRQTNWEFKHGTPDFVSPGNQELCCQRLALHGHCRYAIWQESPGLLRTLIVHPRDVARRQGWHLQPEAQCEGFSMSWLVEQIRKAHGL